MQVWAELEDQGRLLDMGFVTLGLLPKFSRQWNVLDSDNAVSVRKG